MKSIVATLVISFAVLAMTGCRLTRICNSDGGLEVDMREEGKSATRVDDECFGNGLEVEETSLMRNDRGFLVCVVRVRNMRTDLNDMDRRDPFPFQYRFAWLDASGVELQPEASFWRRITLNGGAAESISSTAPSPEAARCVFRARHAR